MKRRSIKRMVIILEREVMPNGSIHSTRTTVGDNLDDYEKERVLLMLMEDLYKAQR